MVLTFTVCLLGSSALLLATMAGAPATQCPFPRIKYGKRLSAARYFYGIGDTVSFVCNRGYTLQGSHTSTCQADLRWSPPLPVCKKEVMCPRPPNIANGLHSGQSLDKFSRGVTVYYGCKDGYELVGNVSINCTETGVWSRPLPRCEAIGCETPKVQNGKVHGLQSTYKAGEILHFDCDTGYAAEDAYESQCQPGGTWDPPVLVCERVRPCPMPPEITNGNHNGQGKGSFTMGTPVTYTCDPGYYLVGNAVVFCRVSGNWTQPGPRCEEVMCPRPPNIANGLHSGQSLDKFSRGVTVYYGCKDGYELVGNMSIYCTETGVWSRPLPRCEAIGCETPKVQNGKVHGLQSTYKAGEILHFDCDTGYAAEDTYESQCQPGGTWDPPVLVCERVRPCPMPPGVRNGNHNGQGKAFFTVGMAVTYTCDPGYYLVGNAVVFCRVSGNWTQPGPRCEVTVCLNPDIENGRQVGGQGLISAPGQMVTFQCHDGYGLQGSANIFCQEDGIWHPPAPICNRLYHYQEFSNRPELPGGCGAPTRLHFAELNEEHKNEIDFSVGKTVQYTCRPGYAKHPGMSPTITCLESGVWSEALEFCKRKQCNHPGEPVNGKIIFLTDLLFGSTVLYSCEEGHRLIGQSSRRCEISGGRVAWSGDIPTCQRIPCEPPPDIPNGKHTGRLLDEFHFGTSVTYTCNPGYPLHGEPSIYCTTQDGKNGVWSGPPPRCGAGCNAPPRLVFAELKEPYSNQTVFPVGRTVEYVCRPGYTQHLGMPPAITCLRNRTWSAALEFCKRKQCDNPGDLENGRAVVLTDLLFGSKVNYTCDEGYKLVGGSQRTCEVSGTRVSWSGAAPVCQRIVCDPPPDIPHGRHSGHLMDTFSYADVVIYTCDPGHPLAGEPSIFCTTEDREHGVWSGPPPRCGEVKCPPPPSIANGKHSGQPSDTHLPGSAVQYTCRDGYSLIGNASISCTAGGTWSRPRPRCEAIGCKRPEIKNGRVTGLETAYGLADIIIFECDFGYALKGSQESQCQFGGTWDPPVPICEKMLECPSPPNIKNGHHETKDVKVFIPGISVKYYCDPGYVLTGTTTVSCLTSGTWSIPYPRCEVITCRSPNIQNGDVAEGQSAVYRPGANVTFQCRPGYVLRGSREAKCQPDGRWAPAVPTCEPVVPCPPPPVIAHATHSAELGTNFTSGMSVTYSCQPGFSLLGDPSVLCTASGNWSLPYPRCAAGCGTPTPLLFAELNKDYKNHTEFPVGKTVKYTCRPGYVKHPQIPPTITCLENQTWSEAQEFCKRRKCNHPGEPENGRVIVTTDLFFGSTVNYTCNEGHRLVGASQRHCVISSSGTRVRWSGDAPVCQSIVCDPPPDIPHGRHSGHLMDTFSYADVVIYTCDPGHPLAGEPSIFCTTEDGEHGVWSGPPPRCGVSQCSHPPAIANGKHSGQGRAVFASGMSVSYACDPGYVLVGEAQLNCTSSGAWSVPAPRCEGRLCPSPSAIDHGQHDGKDVKAFIPGKSVNYSCDPGYSLIGKTTLYCTVNGTWSIPYPRCEVITCTSPDVQNGDVAEGQSAVYRPGANVTLQCRPGYVLRGSREAKCQPDGRWAPAVPTCEPVVPCPPPPVIAHATHSAELGTNFTSGMSVTYSCQPGFSLLGDPSVLCTASGNWSLPYPRCAAGCGTPTPLLFAELNKDYKNQTEFPVGKTVKYTCRPGYVKHPQIPPTITCLENQTWSEAQEFCKRRKCNHPGEPENGRVIVTTDLFFGSTVNYTCNEGHRLVGASQRHCVISSSGTRVRWSGDAPVCQSIVCDPPPDIPHGRHSGHLMDTFSYADVVIYTCDPGHPLAGEPSIFCTTEDGEHGVWSGPPPRCGGRLCPSPSAIDHGQHDGKDVKAFIPGKSVNYSCDPGYSLIGKTTLYCTVNGTWSIPYPRCEVITCTSPDVQNGDVAEGQSAVYRPGANVTLQCRPGYVLRGSREAKCQPDGRWAPAVPTCEPVVPCPPPPVIAHATHSAELGTNFTSGMSVTYSCQPGFSLLGDPSVLCTASGNWSLPYPRCAAGCGTPTPLLFAELNKDYKNQTEFPVGKTVKYTCRPGYVKHPQIPPTITCLENQTWSEAQEFCKRRKCNHPGEPENGRVIVTTDLFFGSTVNYTCNEGHRLVGASQRHCVISSSGTRVRWSGDAPVCQSIVCDPPPDIPHGRHSGHLMDTFSYADVVIYTCDPGHPLAGEPSIFCTTEDGEHGVWSGPPPRCGVSQCSHPPAIANGKHSGQGRAVFASGMSVSYACDPGYVLVGEAQLNCTSSGAWSVPAPRCEGRLCPSPSAIDHGQHDGKDVKAFIPGKSVNYSCDPGYSLIGKTTLYCTVNGTWSIPYPRCEVITCTSPDVQNGDVAEGQSAVYRPGANVTFQCRPGYVLRGSREAKCQPDGRWAPAVPTCEPVVPCPPPPVIAHATHSAELGTNFTSGMSVTYSCQPGFSLLGDPSVLCTASGNWSLPYPRCAVLQCSSPPNIDKGNHNSQELDVFTTGMVVNYSCDPGYRLLGEASIYCTDSGNWSLPLPRCAGGCGAPPNLTFAELTEEYKNLMEFPVGDTVRYSCQPGYMKHPGLPPTLTCLKNHTWSEALAFCKRKQCKYPETPKNGRVVVLTDLLFGSTVNYTCEEGHRLVGQSHSRCEIFGPDAAWSGVPPICQKVVCPVPRIQNGRVSVLKYRYMYKDTVSFNCHKGFTLRGHHTAQCQADKTWDPPVPVCEQDGVAEHYHHPDITTKPAVKCLPPPSIANGEHSSHFSDTFDVGTLVHYRCKHGFSLIGNKSVRCTTYGLWSHPLPRCEVLHCSKPADIAHGSLSGPAKAFFTPGTSVRYTCEPGFSLIGTASIYCTESGAWSHPSPVCQVVKCLHPPTITNGYLKGNISDTFSYGASVSYSCNPGYSLVGNAFINCTVSGTWSQPPPWCKEIRCVFPEVQGVKKAIKGNTYRSGTNITLECDDGYTLEGINQIQCQEDFSWDPPVPACKLTSHKSGSVGLGVAAAGVLLLLGAGIVWKIISKQKEGYYHTYENYSYQTPLNQITEQKRSCLP
ncbi:hypothetical protein QYF61_016064 [Mycteria americana]|uniref:Sushi domain-containing protein n=2 Tax=Aequornithes TaxID=3073812 RepID=A0AAN7MLM4_MYCAM|nr:hypothetical protein QYF61_016064 [Mycteria americana]